MNDGIPFLSVIIPAYNEARRIGPTLRDIDDYLRGRDYQYEIIVVDDGSRDDTCDVVESYARTIPHLKLMNGEPNHGKGYAVMRGMRAARGQWRLFMDADNSVKLSELERFLPETAEGYDVVIASIAHPLGIRMAVVEHAGWHRRFLGSLSKSLIRWLAVPGIYDTQRGFKLFSSHAADVVFARQTVERFGFDIEILAIAQEHGFRIRELPVAWDNPDGSTVRPVDYLRTFRELFNIVSNKRAHRYA